MKNQRTDPYMKRERDRYNEKYLPTDVFAYIIRLLGAIIPSVRHHNQSKGENPRIPKREKQQKNLSFPRFFTTPSSPGSDLRPVKPDQTPNPTKGSEHHLEKSLCRDTKTPRSSTLQEVCRIFLLG